MWINSYVDTSNVANMSHDMAIVRFFALQDTYARNKSVLSGRSRLNNDGFVLCKGIEK